MTADAEQPSERSPPAEKLGRSFRVIFAGQISHAAGEAASQVMFPLLLLQFTSDPRVIAGLFAAESLCALAFGLITAGFIDRIDRRWVVVGANGMRAVLIGCVLVLIVADELSVPALFLLVGTASAMDALFSSGVLAMLQLRLPKGQFARAFSFLIGGDHLCNLVVKPLATALFAASAVWGLGAMGICFAGSVLLFATIRGSHRAPRTDESASWKDEYRRVLRWLRDRPALCDMIALHAFVNIAEGALLGLLVLYVTEDLGISEAVFGTFIALVPAGGATGVMLVPRTLRRWRVSRLLPACMAGAAVSVALLGVASSAALAAPALFACAALGMHCVGIVQSTLQAAVPSHFYGRVRSLQRLATDVAFPIGALSAGVAAWAFSMSHTWYALGALLVIGTLAFSRRLGELDQHGKAASA